ncbi:MAG: hypothetical protein M3O55_12780 [Actinomycetota bacterium]|nr:hypothetical protein [Actinomycetota bacterium]
MTRMTRQGTQVAVGPDGVFELVPVETFDAFYRRELPGLVAFARALSGSSCAEDIAQDAMLVAYRHWDAVAGLDVPAAWVRRVCANRAVSALRRRGVESGVSVLENARAVRNDASWSRDPAAGTTAFSMATWLSNRPFLAGAKVTRTMVDGRPAWRVSAGLKPGAQLAVVKLGEGDVAPTFTEDNKTTDSNRTTMAYNRTLTGDYTLVDVPGAGVTVIWSWTVGHPRATLAGNQAFVNGLSFG